MCSHSYVCSILLNRKLKFGKTMRLSWSGLWVLTVLLSTSVLDTSLSILNCPSLSDDSSNKRLVCTIYQPHNIIS